MASAFTLLTEGKNFYNKEKKKQEFQNDIDFEFTFENDIFPAEKDIVEETN